MNGTLGSWTLRYCSSGEPQPGTLRQLVSRRAGVTVHGFVGYAAGEPLPALDAILQGSASANSGPICVDLEPGTTFRHSGGGSCAVQRLIEVATGEPFPVAMQRLILDPLGMRWSTFEQPLPASLARKAASGHPPGTRCSRGVGTTTPRWPQ